MWLSPKPNGPSLELTSPSMTDIFCEKGPEKRAWNMSQVSHQTETHLFSTLLIKYTFSYDEKEPFPQYFWENRCFCYMWSIFFFPRLISQAPNFCLCYLSFLKGLWISLWCIHITMFNLSCKRITVIRLQNSVWYSLRKRRKQVGFECPSWVAMCKGKN